MRTSKDPVGGIVPVPEALALPALIVRPLLRPWSRTSPSIRGCSKSRLGAHTDHEHLATEMEMAPRKGG
ncbi:MAG: hypothetical protein ACLFUV_07480 [Methanomassiliicoccales archaeon]